MNPDQKARFKLLEYLTDEQKKTYLEHGFIKCYGSDGDVYSVSNYDAMKKFGIPRILNMTQPHREICVDAPFLPQDDKVLIFKLIVENQVRILY